MITCITFSNATQNWLPAILSIFIWLHYYHYRIIDHYIVLISFCEPKWYFIQILPGLQCFHYQTLGRDLRKVGIPWFRVNTHLFYMDFLCSLLFCFPLWQISMAVSELCKCIWSTINWCGDALTQMLWKCIIININANHQEANETAQPLMISGMDKN